jgi:hypothetical protein
MHHESDHRLSLKKFGKIINDRLMSPEDMATPPRVFGENAKEIKNNFFMIDRDAPRPEAPTMSPILHWLNLQGYRVVPYMGPHPPRDSAPHRYYIIQVAKDQDEEPSPSPLFDNEQFENHRHNFPQPFFPTVDDWLRAMHLHRVAQGMFLSGSNTKKSSK